LLETNTMTDRAPRPKNCDFPLLRVLLSCPLAVDSDGSAAPQMAASSALQTI
jgi:hypothetical protein